MRTYVAMHSKIVNEKNIFKRLYNKFRYWIVFKALDYIDDLQRETRHKEWELLEETQREMQTYIDSLDNKTKDCLYNIVVPGLPFSNNEIVPPGYSFEALRNGEIKEMKYEKESESSK